MSTDNSGPLYRYASTTLVPSTGPVEIAGPQMRRKGVIISTPKSSRVTITFGADATLDQGINLYPGTAPLQLTQEWIGRAIRENISAVCASGSEYIHVVDVFTG